MQAVEAICPVRPRGEVLHICQNREREKTFLRQNGFPHAEFRVVDSAESLAAAIGEIGTPSVLKTADFGYDGKGQVKLNGPVDAAELWGTSARRAAYSRPGCLSSWSSPSSWPEEWTAWRCPSRLPRTSTPTTFSIFRSSPAVFRPRSPKRRKSSPGNRRRARRGRAAGGGVFLTRDGRLVVNELAPRPHNSGHYTFDACATSQFEQQLRAVCGLPLGSPELLTPVVMWNILGHLWKDGEPRWDIVLSEPKAKLHLYGKAEARPGRKMGHVCVLGPIDEALATIGRLKAALGDER